MNDSADQAGVLRSKPMQEGRGDLPTTAPHLPVPRPEMTDYAKVQIATEVAFGALLSEAKKQGLPVLSVMGLMYMPTQEVTRQWREACRAVLGALGVEVSD